MHPYFLRVAAELLSLAVVGSDGYGNVEVPMAKDNNGTKEVVLQSGFWTTTLFPADLWDADQSCFNTEQQVYFLSIAFLVGFLIFNIGHQIFGDREQWVEDCLNERDEEMFKWAMSERFEDMHPHEGVKRYSSKEMRKIKRRLQKTGERRHETWDESPEFIVPDRFYEKFASKFKIPKKGLLGTAKCMLLMEQRFQKIPMAWNRFREALMKREKAFTQAAAISAVADDGASSSVTLHAVVGEGKRQDSIMKSLLGASSMSLTAARSSLTAVAAGAGRVASLSIDMAESAADIVAAPSRSIVAVASDIRHGFGFDQHTDENENAVIEGQNQDEEKKKRVPEKTAPTAAGASPSDKKIGGASVGDDQVGGDDLNRDDGVGNNDDGVGNNDDDGVGNNDDDEEEEEDLDGFVDIV